MAGVLSPLSVLRAHQLTTGSGGSDCGLLGLPIWQEIFHFSVSRPSKMGLVTQPEVWRGLDLYEGTRLDLQCHDRNF